MGSRKYLKQKSLLLAHEFWGLRYFGGWEGHPTWIKRFRKTLHRRRSAFHSSLRHGFQKREGEEWITEGEGSWPCLLGHVLGGDGASVWTVRTGWSWSLLLRRGPENPQGRNGPTNIWAHRLWRPKWTFPTHSFRVNFFL